jgi:quercetin dioxygenase-like cupin family protein
MVPEIQIGGDMNLQMPISFRIRFILGILFSVFVQAQVSCQTDQSSPQPCVVQFSDTTTLYQPVLTGPPQTTSMESGVVTLKPGKSGTQHSTKNYEEAVIVISGEGEMIISGGPTMKLTAHSVAYCPIKTAHNVRNSGTMPLKYVYVAAKVVK